MESLRSAAAYGQCEVEVCCGGEADLHKHWTRCEKNPDHLKFIPVDQFNIDCLPSDYQDSDLVDYVRAMSDLTVRVDVGYVSEARPETFPGSDELYPFYDNRGCLMPRVGSGWVSWVENHVKVRNIECECKFCCHHEKNMQVAYIHIITAAHVVFDDLEAAQTRCYLFFNRGGTPAVCESAVRLTRTASVKNDVKRDWCEMTYRVYDLDLASQLEKILTRLQDLQETVVHKFRPYVHVASLGPPCDGPIDNPQDALTIVVSHPHGCSKHVSIGHCTHLSVAEGEWTKYTYSAATCKGSSGAPVFVLGRDSRWWWWSTHVHCGNCQHDKDIISAIRERGRMEVDMLLMHSFSRARVLGLGLKRGVARRERHLSDRGRVLNQTRTGVISSHSLGVLLRMGSERLWTCPVCNEDGPHQQ